MNVKYLSGTSEYGVTLITTYKGSKKEYNNYKFKVNKESKVVIELNKNEEYVVEDKGNGGRIIRVRLKG